MKLVLIRHGRPDEADTAQPHDPPLRADGWQQARAVAALLARQGITRIVSSPLTRARQTAEPAAELLCLPIEIVDGWAEADRHLARYRSIETLRALGDTQWQRFLEDPVRFLGGDPQVFRAAVLDALQAVVDTSKPDAQVAIFTHGLPINVVLAQALGLSGMVHFRPGYASITRLLAFADRWMRVFSINEGGHRVWTEKADS